MVQIDVFWSYAIGAGFAVAASRQLTDEYSKVKDPGFINTVKNCAGNRYFTMMLLYLGLFFAPSGAFLLWNFPSWETMHLLINRDSIPTWLALIFTITNISQVIIGFLIAHWLIKKSKPYAAFLTIIIAYIFFWFITVHGWDGKGFQRFFSVSQQVFSQWTWEAIPQWLSSPIAISIFLMGLVMIPVLILMMINWITYGKKIALSVKDLRIRQEKQSKGEIVFFFLLSVFGGSLGTAVMASFIIHLVTFLTNVILGWIIGGALSISLIIILGTRRHGYFYFMYRHFLNVALE